MIPPYNASTKEELNDELKTYFMKDSTFNIFTNYKDYT